MCLYLSSDTVDALPKNEASPMKEGHTLGADSSGNFPFHLGPVPEDTRDF